jgi:hypothetical protein
MKDIDQIRRDNMAALESEAGGSTAAASRLGWSQSQWSNLRIGSQDSKTGKPRGMRKETARRIESAFGRPLGWLDVSYEEIGSDRKGSGHPGDEKPRAAEFIDLKKEAGDMAKRAMRIAYAWIKLPEEEQAKIWAELIEGGLPASSEGSRKAILDDAIPDADFRTQDPIQKSG